MYISVRELSTILGNKIYNKRCFKIILLILLLQQISYKQVYNIFFMLPTKINLILLVYLTFTLMSLFADCHPVDIVIGREYQGQYMAKQAGKTFEYLNERSGKMIAIFYGSPNRESVNSLEIILLDPKYEDQKVVLVDIKGMIEINEITGEWSNSSHPITYTLIWKQREQDTYQDEKVSTSISFQNLGSEDYQAVGIHIEMKGNKFQFTADLAYYNQVISTMSYSIYVTGVIAMQIISAYMLLKIMDAPNFVFTAKISLLTLSLCNIEDFSQTMTHIQYIMSSQSGYLFFILPSLSFIVLFIIFDMKMLFLVWRSHNMANMDNPQVLRKKLTAFYIQFYLGLFMYLTLTYFFSNDDWMILLRNLILVPQIIHNIRLGHKPSFNIFYIFGYIGSRLFIPLYQRLCPQNRFHLAPNITLVMILLSLFLFQVLLLALQYRLGSRFFVPKRFLPNYFNYRQKTKITEQNREEECAICLQNLFSPESSLPTHEAINDSLIRDELLSEITLMKTPCSHNFHEECLAQWMEVKLECPTCRAALPPL